ncbi:hypothetical protein SMALA_8198 [Streptomyces malaysiensis subsp. malaysiensis]|nr:hypothetical protein SMALA_8198 [Streptomyces malaysiensis]
MSARQEAGTATGQRLAQLSVPELLAGTGARFVPGWVTAMDADAKTVRIDHDRVLRYALRSVSHPEVYAIGDAVAIRQGYGIMHGTCQGGMPTGVHAALSIDRGLRGKQPKPFRFGYYHTPVSLGRGDAVVQFTRPDESPRRICPTGRTAVRYKETVTASPWPTYGRMKKVPASGAFWPRGGRYTRVRGGTGPVPPTPTSRSSTSTGGCCSPRPTASSAVRPMPRTRSRTPGSNGPPGTARRWPTPRRT